MTGLRARTRRNKDNRLTIKVEGAETVEEALAFAQREVKALFPSGNFKVETTFTFVQTKLEDFIIEDEEDAEPYEPHAKFGDLRSYPGMNGEKL